MSVNCRRVVNLISAYVDGELTGAEMLAIRRHLSDCPECAEEHESMRFAKRSVARLRTAVPREEFAALIVSRLNEVSVPTYQRVLNTLGRFVREKLSPVAAALAASGVALVILSAGGVDSIYPDSSALAVSASSRARTQEIAFIRQLQSDPNMYLGQKPLKIADRDDESGAYISLASLSTR